MEAPVRTNIKRSNPLLITTHEGGPARHITNTQQLRRLVLPCLLWEDSFYVDGKTIADQISDAVKAAPAPRAAVGPPRDGEVAHRDLDRQ
jgi:hypothetical protein